MHVRIKCAAALCLALASFAGGARAVEFNETLQTPLVKGAELKNLAESYSSTFARLEAASPTESITNQSLFLQHFDVEWQIQRAVDQKRLPEDLGAVGLVKKEDGSISIDLAEYPQWDPFAQKISSFLPEMNFDSVGPLLINRGFRESDVIALKEYVASRKLKSEVAAKALPITLSFSRLVKKYDNTKRPVGNDLVFSYLYQRSKAEALAKREWAAGVLKVLDPQRVRVLHSYFYEMKGRATWAASDVDAGTAVLLALMRLPDFEQRAMAEAKGVAP